MACMITGLPNWTPISPLTSINHTSDYAVVQLVNHKYDYELRWDDTKSTYQLIIKINTFNEIINGFSIPLRLSYLKIVQFLGTQFSFNEHRQGCHPSG